MGDKKNLSSQEAIEKMRTLAIDANVCMFVTNLSKQPLASRPMATQEVDDDGKLWFFSDRNSNKNMDILNDNQVQLFYSNTGSYEYMSIYGKAEIIYDRQKIEDLWTPVAKAWFKEGKDDPELTLIKVTPEDAYYWDTKDNKMVSFIKIALGAMGVKNMDDGGIEGNLVP